MQSQTAVVSNARFDRNVDEQSDFEAGVFTWVVIVFVAILFFVMARKDRPAD